jgi:DNA-directed RNA polymerase specialized sigma subunit
MQKPKKHSASFDDSFYRLAGEIATALAKNKTEEEKGLTSTEAQKRQVEELLDAEKKFKEVVLKYRQSTEVYKKFLQRVCIQNRNILSARPYFREAATTFSQSITPAIKTSNIEELKRFNINYQFIKFIKDNWLGPFPKRADELFTRVYKARTILIENNMPLAVNRAKLFYRKTPRSHLTLMDMIGICSMGLAAGIDKWCGSYTPVFRSVCIGRMVGNLIDCYSETMLHFYPSDKRVLYKANSIRGRQGIDEINELTDAVNKSFKQDELDGKSIPKYEVKAGELSDLMNAASTVSADSTVNDEGYGVYSYTQDASQDIESAFIERESTVEMLMYAKHLPILHRKVLRLKGIKI